MRDIDNSMQAFGSETDTISLARRLASTRDGCLIEIEVVDTQSGRFSLELASTDSRGGLSVMSTCHPDMDQAAGNVAAELLDLAEADGLLVTGDHRSLLACHDAWRACANSLNGRLAGAVLHLEVGETRAAMLSDGPDGLTLVIADRDGDAQSFGLDLGVLRLGAWRHVTAMRLVEDALLAAVADPTAGFDLFCFDLTAKQSAPTLLMTRGAHRFAVNAAVSAIRSSPYGILIGTAALAGPTQSFGSWGPELLLVTPDRDWDLLVGQPRFSPDGLKVPVSNLAPGFGDPQNAAIKAICHQELKGKPTAVIAMQAFSAAPEDDRRKAASDLFHYAGALRLFRSEDLRQWDEAPHDLGPDIGSVTDICMTASGLLVGHERLGRDQPPVSFVPLD